MNNALFDHIKTHKIAYLAALLAVIVGVNVWAYNRIPDFDALRLTGATGRAQATPARIISPNGGETFTAGGAMSIQWEVGQPSVPGKQGARSVPTTVDIYLRTVGPNSGVLVGTAIVVPRKDTIEVSRNVTGTTYNYTIRQDLVGKWKVVVLNKRLQAIDESDAPFTIERYVAPEPEESAEADTVASGEPMLPSSEPALTPESSSNMSQSEPAPGTTSGLGPRVPGPLPDLIVERIEVRPAPASHPGYYEFFATVKNIGEAGTTEQVWTYFEGLNAGLNSVNGTQLNVYTAPLAAGESRVVSMGINQQCSSQMMATEHLKATVDLALREGQRVPLITESNENNNVLQILWPSDRARCNTPGALNVSRISENYRTMTSNTNMGLMAFALRPTGEPMTLRNINFDVVASGDFSITNYGLYNYNGAVISGPLTTPSFGGFDLPLSRDVDTRLELRGGIGNLGSFTGDSVSTTLASGDLTVVGNNSGAVITPTGLPLTEYLFEALPPAPGTLTFARVGGDAALANGQQTLLRFTTNAGGGEPVRLDRLYFNVYSNLGSDGGISNYSLYRDNIIAVGPQSSSDFLLNSNNVLLNGDSAIWDFKGEIWGANMVPEYVNTSLSASGVTAIGNVSGNAVAPTGLPFFRRLEY